MQVFYNPLFPSFRAWQLPEPPSPPSLLASLASNHQTSSNEKSPDKPPTPSTGSIGQSPVVQAFLLRLQELGMSNLPETDGDDALSGWSKSLADGGDGDDVIFGDGSDQLTLDIGFHPVNISFAGGTSTEIKVDMFGVLRAQASETKSA